MAGLSVERAGICMKLVRRVSRLQSVVEPILRTVQAQDLVVLQVCAAARQFIALDVIDDVGNRLQPERVGEIHRIPGRAKYQNIKLTRPINHDTKKVANWIAKIKIEVKRQTAEIAALDSEGKPIATWNLEGVFPVKWTGPSLDIGANQVATETLELAHNGFLT